MFCNRCGHRNPPSSRFCSSCGAELDASLRDDSTIAFQVPERLRSPQDVDRPRLDPDLAAALAPGTGVLVVVSGATQGLEVPLVAQITRLGRHPSSEVFLDDVTVSRRHVEIERTPDGYVARDVGSLNGTYVNRRRIEQARLAPGDELQIGKFKLLFLVAGPPG